MVRKVHSTIKRCQFFRLVFVVDSSL